MEIDPIRKKIEHYQSLGKRLFCTSSFQTHSVVLLHLISRIDRNIPVYFINTGYHFAETLVYRDKIAGLLRLQVHNLNPLVPKIMQRNEEGNLLFTTRPDYCCYLNKVQPVDALLEQFDVWVNGVRAEQTIFRSTLQEEQVVRENIIRYHPVLHWTSSMIESYLKKFKLPRHPLEAAGYSSIGCEPCTRPAVSNQMRSGRWYGQNKEECGLNEEMGEKGIKE